MNASEGGQTIGERRCRKRTITNARKEQNRVSQRLYRQRQRERAQDRESRSLLPRKPPQLRPRQPLGTCPETNERITINTTECAPVEIRIQSSHDVPLYGYALPELVPNDELDTNEPVSLPMNYPSLLLGTESSMPIDSLSCEGILFQNPVLGINTNDMEPFNNTLSTSNIPPTASTIYNAPNTPDWPYYMATTPATYSVTEYELLENGSANTSLCHFNSMQVACWHCQLPCESSILETTGENIGSTCLDAHVRQIPGFRNMLFLTSKFVREGRVPSPAIVLPDACINLIQSSLTTTLIALYHNACSIGANIQDLFDQKSPFYSPDTTIASDPQTLLTTACRSWMPIHLHPTLPQILIRHHPYLDLLPFPALRARAITLANATPQLFHPMELKLDILRGGLYYFRSVNRHGCQQPWDMRSWKAEPWFLTKWRLLLG